MIPRYVVVSTLLFAAGCASVVPGASKEADVLARFGSPAEQRNSPDGGKVLDFPRTPLGYENWRVTLGPDGVVRSVEQLLEPSNFARLKAGMTMAEVRAQLGRHAEAQKFPNLSEEVLSWRFMEHGNRFYFNAHFDASGRFKYASRTEEVIVQNEASSQ